MAASNLGDISHKLGELITSVLFLSKRLIKNDDSTLADKLIKAALLTQENMEQIETEDEGLFYFINKSIGSLWAMDYLLKNTPTDSDKLDLEIAKIDRIRQEIMSYLYRKMEKA